MFVSWIKLISIPVQCCKTFYSVLVTKYNVQANKLTIGLNRNNMRSLCRHFMARMLMVWHISAPHGQMRAVACISARLLRNGVNHQLRKQTCSEIIQITSIKIKFSSGPWNFTAFSDLCHRKVKFCSGARGTFCQFVREKWNYSTFSFFPSLKEELWTSWGCKIFVLILNSNV